MENIEFGASINKKKRTSLDLCMEHMLAGQRDDGTQEKGHAAAATEAFGSVHVRVLDRLGKLRAGRPIRPGEHFTIRRTELRMALVSRVHTYEYACEIYS